ncbi:MAG: DNA-directed RNA polymerase subunit omega [Candidatus Schekmanbacteria bacterium]|nr:DNA-directed RNA polymerase subunit omega [Candidatus Schekmanbacteria bacterium]
MAEQSTLIQSDSRYARVMTIARRARQIMRESKDKRLQPADVALGKFGAHKPIKLAEEELKAGFVGFKLRDSLKSYTDSLSKPVKTTPSIDTFGKDEESGE